jgi:sugar O-acyltransferase (sialic acid O-acetyltransferase NeuD family)
MKRLFIYGCGAHARKVAHYARACGFELVAFVDENPGARAPLPHIALRQAASLDAPGEDDAMFVAIGDPAVRRRLMDRLAAANWALPALVHPSAVVAPDAVIGAGALIAAAAVVETATVIGRGAIVDIGVLVDHECEIGEFCHLRPGEVLGPRTKRAGLT